MLSRGLSSQHVERVFAIHHDYLLWAGRPAAVTPSPAVDFGASSAGGRRLHAKPRAAASGRNGRAS